MQRRVVSTSVAERARRRPSVVYHRITSLWIFQVRQMVEGNPKRELNGLEVAMGRPSTGSEVVMMDDRVLETAARASLPTIQNLNVSKSTKVHIGPKIVRVTQNVDNTEMVKGKILGLELVSPMNSRRLRCSIAVFVCWALVVACALVFCIFYFSLATKDIRLDIGITEPWYLRRADWQAMPEYSIDIQELPLPHVMIGHSALEHCTEKYACIKNVLEIQSDHMRRGWIDIGPNYLVGGNGLVFEGRGANVVGVMVRSWNTNSVSVMFLGDYSQHTPAEVQFENLSLLLEELVRLKVLRPDYIVYGHCQVAGPIIAPGHNVVEQLYRFKHWSNVNTTSCMGFRRS